MWVDPTHSYTDMEDNNNCVCKFPYRDVSPSFQTLVCEHYASSSECVGVVEQCRCFHSSDNLHPGRRVRHCSSLCEDIEGGQRPQVLVSEKCNKKHYFLLIFSSVWKRRFLREKKISLMMGTITAAFLICVTPYYIIFMSPVELEVKEAYLPILAMVMYLNSLVNPLLYVILNSEVREGVFRLLLCKRELKGQRSRMDTGESNLHQIKRNPTQTLTTSGFISGPLPMWHFWRSNGRG